MFVIHVVIKFKLLHSAKCHLYILQFNLVFLITIELITSRLLVSSNLLNFTCCLHL